MKKYLPATAFILNAIGLVILFTCKSWGAEIAWYKFTGCMLIMIGFIATFAIWLVYILFMKLMGQSLEI